MAADLPNLASSAHSVQPLSVLTGGSECSAPAIPTGPCPVCPRLALEFEPWRQAAYWQAMFQRAVQREAILEQTNASLQARIRSLEQSLFGSKTEATGALSDRAPRRRRLPSQPARVVSNADSPVPNAVIIPTCQPSRKRTLCQTTNNNAAPVAYPLSPFLAPKTVRCWRSRYKPIVVSFAAAAIDPHVTVAATVASSRLHLHPS